MTGKELFFRKAKEIGYEGERERTILQKIWLGMIDLTKMQNKDARITIGRIPIDEVFKYRYLCRQFGFDLERNYNTNLFERNRILNGGDAPEMLLHIIE